MAPSRESLTCGVTTDSRVLTRILLAITYVYLIQPTYHLQNEYQMFVWARSISIKAFSIICKLPDHLLEINAIKYAFQNQSMLK